METFITAIIPFLFYIPLIFIIWWMMKLKRTNEKQVQQNKEIIELLRKLDSKIQD